MILQQRWMVVWQRNFRVLLKLFIPFLLGNFGDPLIYLLALGYGLGRFVGSLDGIPYLMFLASGVVCSSAMNATTFEGLFSAYIRLSLQKTWEGMLMTPLDVNDIIFGEMIWAATKGLISAIAIFIVAVLLGLVKGWSSLWTMPVLFLMTSGFAGLALIMTALAPGFDFFTYYFTLLITPMMLLSGVFFPIENMPVLIQWAAKLLPLYHAVAVIRPLMSGGSLNLGAVVVHLGVLFLYAIVAYRIAVVFMRKRLIN